MSITAMQIALSLFLPPPSLFVSARCVPRHRPAGLPASLSVCDRARSLRLRVPVVAAAHRLSTLYTMAEMREISSEAWALLPLMSFTKTARA